MRRKKSKYVIIILIGMIAMGSVATILYVRFIRDTIHIKAEEVQSINVVMSGFVKTENYGNNTSFTVTDKSNINNIIEALNLYERRGSDVPCYVAATDYAVTINLKDGVAKEYTMNHITLSSNYYINELLSSKEVVTSIRNAFTIDKSKISKAEYYYWENSNTDTATSKVITDPNVIDEIIEIAKKDVLANPIESMEPNNSGFLMFDKEENTLLYVSIDPSMEGYDELVKLFPEIPEHVEEGSD